MNLYLHGIGSDNKVAIHAGHDSLAAPWKREYTMVLANPPFGKKQSLLFVNEEGDTEKEDQIVFREDFWTSTSNKQLNFVQHIYSLLKIDGRAAMVVPDNVLFEGGAGEKVRRNLLQKCRVHTLVRLPTGIWYSPGVKAQVEIWFSILQRKSLHGASFTSVNQLREHIDAFIDAYNETAKPFVWTKSKVHQKRLKPRFADQ